MPELPDIELYLHALRPRVVGRVLSSISIKSPFVLRTFDPSTDAVEGKVVQSVERIGKRFVFDFGNELFVIVHLMIAGRFRWSDKPDAKLPGKIGLASFRFEHGVLHLVESAKQKRASIHIVRGQDLDEHKRDGVDVRSISAKQLHALLV
ncbi:MAG: DNA-formamidopyrimidine glycosylase family protein, partial [Planctomycetota bacterium]